MALSLIPAPVLPMAPSWFPGHMMKFTRMLPALLTRTDVVLEIRDSRLPLTSINRTLEGALRKWRLERGWDPNNPTRRIIAAEACEHLVVLNKRDLVPEWGTQPFHQAMAKKISSSAFTLRFMATTAGYPKSERDPNIAKQHPHAMELNVLVIGMPNVGKSTLLNALRHIGIKGRTSKAFQTSANPGMTQALSTRLKLSLDPLVYAYDTPGVMLPFLGRGLEGAERGVKLALIAGIKEGLYDMQALAAYLLYRLNVLNPIAPAYLHLLPSGSQPTLDLEDFLTKLAQRMGMIKRGAEVDLSRAAVYFVRWWREEGGLLSASSGFDIGINTNSSGTSPQLTLPPGQISPAQGWGFDFQWDLQPNEVAALQGGVDPIPLVQDKMEQCIQDYVEMTDREESEENNVSQTQMKKKQVFEEKLKRRMKHEKR